MNLEACNNIGNKMHHAYVEASSKSMLLAAKETHSNAVKETDDGTNDETIRVDGTWQRRGYSSLNGVVTGICNRKAIDTEASKNCKSCKYWENKKGTPEYDEWLATHHCPIDHGGSAGAMEAAGALEIFKRSVRLYDLRYTTDRGDGDSKSYKEIVDANVYPGHEIKKSECVGHVRHESALDNRH